MIVRRKFLYITGFLSVFSFLFFLISIPQAHASLSNALCTLIVSVDNTTGVVSIWGSVKEARPGVDPSNVFISIYDSAGAGSFDDQSGQGDYISGGYSAQFTNGDHTAYIQGKSFSNPNGGTSTCSRNQSFTVNVATPVDGGWTGWSDWGSCSVSCGGGTQTSTRTCTNPSPSNGGADCSGLDGGNDSRTQSCNTQSCTISCSGSDTQSCTSGANSCGGTADGTQSRTCDTSNGTWSGWGSCSASPPATPAPTTCTNACGVSATATCGNTCNPPATPAPTTCTSSANACGQTSTGSATCGNTCVANPPPNTCIPTAAISCSPNPVDYNTASTVTWSSTKVSSCTVNGVSYPTNSSDTTGPLTSNQTYTVTCQGFNGSPVSASATCAVKSPGVSISTSPTSEAYSTSVPYGGAPATITWTPSNSGSCTASGDWSGSKDSSTGTHSQSTGQLTEVKTYTYTITCYGANGLSDTKSATVTVNAPPAPTVTLSATPNPVAYNTASTVSWSAPNAISCVVNGDTSHPYPYPATTSDSTGNLITSTTYNFVCTGPTGLTGANSVTVYVIPTADIKANGSDAPATIPYNTTANVTWCGSGASACANATSCSVSGLGSGTSGNYNPRLTSTTTYTLICNGAGGTTNSDPVTVTVGAAPVMSYFRCNGVDTAGTCTIDYGGTAAITWSSSDTTACSLVSTVPTDESVAPSGTNTYTNIIANRNYSIECWGAGAHAPALPMPLHVVVSAPAVTISISPTSVAYGGSSTITWTPSNSGSCTASGDWSGDKDHSTGTHSQSTGPLNQVRIYTYTLVCSGNGSTTQSATVTVIAPPPTTSSVTITQPDYCSSGPAVTMSWGYSDLAGSTQSAYQVQIDDQGAFSSINVDSGKVMSGSNSWFSGQGVLAFNTVYHARVRTWSGYDAVSSWQNATICSGPSCQGDGADSWQTPPYAYPQTDFNWTANGILNNPSPPLNKPVQFNDATVFYGNPNGERWSWTLGDGGTSTTQNPAHTYPTEGSYYVTLIATDNANQVCVRTKGPLIIQKPIPQWREVAPR